MKRSATVTLTFVLEANQQEDMLKVLADAAAEGVKDRLPLVKEVKVDVSDIKLVER